MGLAKIEKIQIIGHEIHKEKIIEGLQDMGSVQLVKPAIAEDTLSLPSALQISSREKLTQKIAELEQTIKYLESLEERKGLFSGIITEKVILDEREFVGMINLDQDKIQEEVKSIQQKFNELIIYEEFLKDELQTILPWVKLPVNLDEVKGTENVELMPGFLPSELFPLFQNDVEKEFESKISLEVVSQDKEKVYLLLAFLQEDVEKFRAGNYDFVKIELPSVQKTALEYSQEINKELKEICNRKFEVQKKAETLKTEKIKLMSLYDYLLNVKKREQAKERFFHFPHSFVLEGWVKKQDLKRLSEDLKEKFNEVEVTGIKPQKDEEIPVALENRKMVQPFEMLTHLYGMPNSKDLDPTPLLAPFFIIYFGLCLTDAGYGVVLIFLMYFFMRRSKVKTNRLVYILFWGGLFTIFAGAITGGWFGDIIDRFPFFSFLGGLKKLMIFDPMKNPIIFLAIALVLGFIQICYGLCAKMYKLFKNGAPLDAISDPFSQLLVMTGLPLLGLVIMKILPNSFLQISLGMIIFGIGNVFFYNFMNTEGSLLIRLFIGGYAIYSTITGCLLGDILSYSRLLALGMATAGIAMTVNVMAQFALDVPIVGIIIAVIIMVVGHSFNILINAFGAFVHSMRLQYVEFFTKFYESGGKEFKPFGKEYKYIVVR